MTREEAIEILQEEWDFCQEPSYVMNAIKMAITALRGPTREQVKNVWHSYHTSGCDVCLGGSPVGYGSNKKYGTYFVDLAGNNLHIMGSRIRINFCPKCGRALTDEAVEMVMERLGMFLNDN